MNFVQLLSVPVFFFLYLVYISTYHILVHDMYNTFRLLKKIELFIFIIAAPIEGRQQCHFHSLSGHIEYKIT